jgi:hypothetical protein
VNDDEGLGCHTEVQEATDTRKILFKLGN